MISSLIRTFNFNTPAEHPSSYLEFRSSTPMTITPKYTNSGVLLQYKIGEGQWTNIASSVTTPSASVILFRGVATVTKGLFNENFLSNAWFFTGATNLECIGNINSLIQDVLGGDVLNISLASSCYSSMFYGCTNLTVAPVLPATTLAPYCYAYMFRECTNLTVAPVLPATTLAASCYAYMFRECTNLTVAPVLPATTLASSCYSSMFYRCTNLTVAPVLPATTLSNNCYNSMFYGCEILNTLIYLPATTLSNSCYKNMFSNCFNIKISIDKTGIYQTEYRIPKTGTGTTATDALTNMFLGSGGTFTGTPNINTAYYTANTIV